MKGLISLTDAQARLLHGVKPLAAEAVSAAEADGRYLAAPVLARRTQPPADLSAMDGYAMKSGESGPWQVVGESAAGHPFSGIVQPGQTIRISTGAMMPDGADAVLLQENAAREGDTLSLNGEGDPTPRHIRRAGFDFRDGAQLLPTATRIGPAQIALAISGGNSSLQVHRLPKVTILDSGDELAADPDNCPPHQIPASNGPMIAALVARYAGEVTRAGPVPDKLEALAAALDHAGDADVIVTSGGASVGDHDLIRPALEAWGAQIDFWRVAMKPGKPLLFARKGGQIVLGLPGNPVSSFVTGFMFLLPLLRALAGSTAPLPRPVWLPLGCDVPAGGSRLEFLRASLADGVVTPVMEQDSSALVALASANVLVERPADGAAAERGTLVPCYLLQNGGVA